MVKGLLEVASETLRAKGKTFYACISKGILIMVNILVPLSRRISKDAFLQDVRDATSNVSTLEFWSRA